MFGHICLVSVCPAQAQTFKTLFLETSEYLGHFGVSCCLVKVKVTGGKRSNEHE